MERTTPLREVHKELARFYIGVARTARAEGRVADAAYALKLAVEWSTLAASTPRFVHAFI